MVLNNNSYFRFLISIVMSISLLTPYTVLAQDYTNLKKNIRVAIFSVQDQVNHNRFGRLDRVILETLTTELVKSNNFTVIDRQQIESLIKESIPDALIEIEDLRGDGDHYSVTIISKSFLGKSKIEQHKMVYDSLKGKMGSELHALMIKTKTE